MDILNFLPDIFLSMATIFYGMGTGTQSGKLRFKSLGGNGVNLSEDEKGITVSSTAVSTYPFLPSYAIVYGNVTNITTGNFSVGESSNYKSIFGLNNLQQNPSCTPNCVCNSQHSIIVGGQNNKMYYQESSTIIGGNYNFIRRSEKYAKSNSIISGDSTCIWGGCMNSQISTYKSMICCGCSYDSSNRSSIISGYKNYLSNAEDSGIISSENSKIILAHTGNPNFYRPQNFSIIGAKNSCITNNELLSSGYLTEYKSYSNSIISSGKSRIRIMDGDNYVTSTSISSSKNSNIQNKIKKCGGSLPLRNSSIISSVGSTVSISSSSIIASYNTYISQNDNRPVDGRTKTGSVVIGSSHQDVDSGKIPLCTYNNVSLFSTSKGSCASRKENTSIISSENSAGLSIATYQSRTQERSIGHLPIIGSECSESYMNEISTKSFVIGTKCSKNIFGGYKNCYIPCCEYSNFIIGGQCNLNASTNVGVIGGMCNSTSFRGWSTQPCLSSYPSVLTTTYIVGGCGNINFNNCLSIVGAGQRLYLQNTLCSSIIGGYRNQILAYGPNFGLYLDNSAKTIYSCQNSVSNSFIVGGNNNCFISKESSMKGCTPAVSPDVKTAPFYRCNAPHHISLSGIIGGRQNCICNDTTLVSFVGLTSSIIIGGSGQINTRSYTTQVQNLMIKGSGGGVWTYDTSGNKCTGLSGVFSSPTSICVINGLVTSIT